MAMFISCLQSSANVASLQNYLMPLQRCLSVCEENASIQIKKCLRMFKSISLVSLVNIILEATEADWTLNLLSSWTRLFQNPSKLP